MGFESRFRAKTPEELTRRGHVVKVEGTWSIGDETAVIYDAQRKVMFGAASPRREKSYALVRTAPMDRGRFKNLRIDLTRRI